MGLCRKKTGKSGKTFHFRLDLARNVHTDAVTK